MKVIITSACILLALFGIKTYAGDERNKQEKNTYEFPEAMAQPVRDQFTKLCDKGRKLYVINCAKCHSTMLKKMEIVPDFTIEQLGAYSIRVANQKHEMNVSEETVSAEELALITTYLTYKKKNH